MTLPAGVRETQDGYLVADSIVARTGIQVYTGAELGLLDRKEVRVYRSPKEVADVTSVRTYSHAPITINHPAEMVTPDNIKDLAVGEVGESAGWEDGQLRLPLIVKDREAIDAIKAGTRELSAGYACDIDWTPGVTEDGQKYDAQQKNIRINHVAIVPRGRAGVARFGDAQTTGAMPLVFNDQKPASQPTEAAMAQNKGTQFVAFDEAYDLSDEKEAERLATRLKGALDAAAEEATELADKHATAMAAKDAEITKLNDEKKELETKLADSEVTPAKINAMIASRTATRDKAVALGLDMKATEEMSEEDMKAEAVKKKMGEDAKGYSPAQIDAAFAVLAKDAKPKSPLADGLTTPKAPEDLTKMYQTRDADLSNAWKAPGKKEEAA